ncbi:MAG: hypothetical protein EPN21_00660 [Methylococcaceae bacterium]|nr:MAG: hypothetical protein EPN21_00660 [Methylococcaceae bacterium]
MTEHVPVPSLTCPKSAVQAVNHHAIVNLLDEADAIIALVMGRRETYGDANTALHGAGRLIQQAKALSQSVIDREDGQ